MPRARACRHRLGLALGLVWLLTAGEPARADSLAADLSERLIAITTAFVGTDVVLFGATDGEGDIVVTVQGPRQKQVVRRKARVGGIWINRDQLSFANAPGYYAVAASGPLEEIARPDVRARLELGVEQLKLRALDADELDGEQIAAFRDALVRRKQLQGLYSEAPAPVTFIGSGLFRARLHFPANVTPGLYRVQVFHLIDGSVGDAQRSSLIISKVGLEADVFDFAQEQAALYGLGAIVIALLAGWLAGLVFRRG